MTENGNYEVMEDDFASSNEMNYSNLLSAQINRINNFLSRLNETPSYVFTTWSKLDNTFNPLDYKPNKDNFVKAVMCLEILLYPKLDKKYKEKIEKIKKSIEETENNKKKEIHELSILKFKYLVDLCERSDLLPKTKRWK